jgi:hypothetical protein
MEASTHSPPAKRRRFKAGLRKIPVYVNTKIAQILLECPERTARRRVDEVRVKIGGKKVKLVSLVKFCAVYSIAEATLHQLLLK